MPYWPGNRPKPKASSPPADRVAVVVEVEAGGDPGVGRRDVVVGVVHRRRAVLADREVVVAEQLGRLAVLGEVELVDEDDVRVGALDRLRGAGACALPGADRSATSWPALPRLSEALKVAKRTSVGLPGLSGLAVLALPGPAAAGEVRAGAPSPATARAATAARARRVGRERMGVLPSDVGDRQRTTGRRAWGRPVQPGSARGRRVFTSARQGPPNRWTKRFCPGVSTALGW